MDYGGCCGCGGPGAGYPSEQSGLPMICLVPQDERAAVAGTSRPRPQPADVTSTMRDFQLLEDDYIKKHFELPPRPMYLDAFKRPLITFPLSQDDSKHFNMAKKAKVNQMILDGFLDPSAAISAPSVFQYGKTEHDKSKETEEEDEIIYILQLPDYEFTCPTHNQTVRTPRFIWHSCKKKAKKAGKGQNAKQGGGPLNRPKPWLLSRHTDFDLQSQW